MLDLALNYVPRSSEQQVLSSTWLLCTEFYIAVHLLIADIQIDKKFPEYTQEHFEASTSYFRKHMN
jgi:hypothetical protein